MVVRIGDKMKKGFTLIELIAVIVILGIISLIATAVVMNVIETGRKQAILINTEKALKAIDTYKTTYEVETGRELKNVTYTIEDSRINSLDLEINGILPNSGEVTINNNGDISIYTYDSGFCAVKSSSDGIVSVIKINKESCNYNSTN